MPFCFFLLLLGGKKTKGRPKDQAPRICVFCSQKGLLLLNLLFVVVHLFTKEILSSFRRKTNKR
jgi:hypothetical protein